MKAVETAKPRNIEKHAKPKKRSWQHDQSMLDRDVLPAWRHKRMKDVSRRDVRELLEQIAERAPIVANRTRSLLHKMFNVGIRLDVVESNPVTATDRPGTEHQRDRVLSHDEIRTFWKACDALPLEIAAAPPDRSAATVKRSARIWVGVKSPTV